jgi:PAS domain-containing protein
MEADDACQPEQAERFNAIEGKNPQMFLFQRPGHSTENLLCEGRDWVWRKWEQKEPFGLEIELFTAEGEHTSLSYSDIMTDGRWQIVILVRKEVVDESAHPGASHRVVQDEQILAVTVQRRFARKGDPDRTRVVPESESEPPDSYELHFLDEAGKDVAAL